jgi:hypothetical protein
MQGEGYKENTMILSAEDEVERQKDDHAVRQRDDHDDSDALLSESNGVEHTARR